MIVSRRFLGALGTLLLLLPTPVAFAAATRWSAAAEGRLVDLPGMGGRAEVVTFGAEFAPALLRATVGETVTIGGWPVAPGKRADVEVRRFEIYAADAHIFQVDGDRRTEVPRSRMAFFQGEVVDDAGTRIFIGVDANGAGLQGFALSQTGSFEIRPFAGGTGNRQHLVTVPLVSLGDETGGGAEPLSWTCGQSSLKQPLDFLQGTPAVRALAAPSEVRSLFAAAALPALHTVTIAVDTDNELLLQKFSDNTTNATSYIAALIAAMNVIYERDENLRLLQGTTFLRVSTTPDPYAENGSGASVPHLNEFSNYWFANNGAVSRGLAMMLSGKSANAFSSSGIAWLNGLCSTSFGYSYSQVFKFMGSTGSSDAFVVGHELGHNFGSPHTHCYTPEIDFCHNGEALSGCYGGATSCPASTTINGVPNVRGTLMSYCHLLGGCTASNVFHSRTVDLFTSLITPEIGICVFPVVTPPTFGTVTPSSGLASGSTPVTITGTLFQNGATVSFGGAAATSVLFNSPNSLSATTPAHAAGPVNVVVTNPDGGAVTGTNAYTFDPIPSISSLVPNSGTTAGGTSVVINGANFQNGATVVFGGTGVPPTFNSSAQLTVTSPAHATGTASLVVTNPDLGTVTRTEAFFYTPPPTATDFYTLAPCRVIDTRNANGPFGGPALVAGADRLFTVPTACGVDLSAVAISANITIVSPGAAGSVSVFPGNAMYLGTNEIAFGVGTTRANNAVFELSTDGSGQIKVRNLAAVAVHFVMDVNGEFR